jgi:hypothetical protein
VEEDDYVFDGGDVFEDEDESDSGVKGGKRLAQDEAMGAINWPRLITFICSLVIIVAALVILFAFVYPKIHKTTGDSGVSASAAVSDTPASSEPSAAQSEAVSAEPDGEETDEPDSEASAEPEVDSTTEPDGETTTEPSQEPASSSQVSSVTGLSLSKTDVTLKASESFTLTASVTPSGWSGTITWSSSNESAAKVSSSGVVTNVNSGSDVKTATITASAGGKSVECIVRCQGGSSSTASSGSSETSSSGSLSLNRTDFTMTVGETFAMKATGADSVTWSIGNTSVATISDSGTVTAVAAGQTTITATTADGQTVTCIVRVKG